MKGLGALLLAVAVVLAPLRALGDEKRGKRTVAVLEYRAGATGAPDLGMRLALILRTGTSHEIIDPDDARRLAGAKLDELVAKCGGEADCIAALGRRIDADEVVLVGVSEFGDLILALQLVDTKTGRVVARVADSLPQDAEPDDGKLEGYLKRLLPPSDFLRYGTIRVKTDVKGATVAVNGKATGKTPVMPIIVAAPQTVDLRVSKAGYVDFTARIDVLPDGSVEVNPTLQRREGRGAWYGRWWVWAIVGGVVIGGVATAIVLTNEGADSVPVVAEW